MNAQAPNPSNKPFRWRGKGDTKWRGEYRTIRNKGSKRAKKYIRSRVRANSGKSALGKEVKKTESRSGINAKENKKTWEKYRNEAWAVYVSLMSLETIPLAQKMTALYLGEEHGLLATDAFRVMTSTADSSNEDAANYITFSLHMIRRWFREAGMGQKQRMAVKQLYLEKGLTVTQIYQDFQSRREKTPLAAIVNWIAALKK